MTVNLYDIIDYSSSTRIERIIISLNERDLSILNRLLEIKKNNPDSDVFPSQLKLGEQLGCARTTVNRSINKLHRLKIITKINRSVSHNCIYIIIPELYKNPDLKEKLSHILPALQSF